MRRIAVTGLALLAASILPAAVARAADDEATAIARDLDERFAKYCNAGDLGALLPLYTNESVVIFPAEPAIGRDRVAVEGMLKRACDPKSGTSYRLDSIHALRIGPDHISVSGEWTITAPGKDGKPASVKARATELLVKTPTGWRYLVDHASAAPPATPAAE